MPKTNEYRITGGDKPVAAPRYEPQEGAWDKPEPYTFDDDLVEAVNLAISLNRPLLLEGEAGCGKTKVARAVAYQLGLPLEEWFVRSSTKARDGMYHFEALLRLHDVQLAAANISTGDRNPANASDYVKLRELGRGFERSHQGITTVLLIDEIDKADLDFPNDLLTILDEPYTFAIEETGTSYKANSDNLPIVIITSNKEKAEMPLPFLRRCVFHTISFPNTIERLTTILDSHPEFAPKTAEERALADEAARQFLHVRESSLAKKPGTSEFLDWYRALGSYGDKPYSADTLQKSDLLPYRGLLLKTKADMERPPTLKP